MNNILSIIREIQADSSKTGKELILKREINNEEFKQFIKYTHNPEFVYGLAAGKLNKALKQSYINSYFDNLFSIFEYLLAHNSGTDKTAQRVASFINNSPEELKEFYIHSITKTLRLGCNVTTINKVYPNLIEKFEVQRAKSYDDYASKLKGKLFSLSEKKNGIRCISIKENGIIKNLTRQNKHIGGLNDINKQLLELPDGVYDGELVTINEPNLRLRNILQETKKIVNSDMEDKKDINYWVFDYMTTKEFNLGKSNLNYFERRDTNPLNSIKLENIIAIPELYRGKDTSVICPLLDDLVDTQGREGLMYYQDKKYVSKRTDNILKIKKKYTSDLRIVGFDEGKARNKGRLGAFVLDYKGFLLNCSGMSDKIREDVWQNKEKYLGIIIEVEHEQETTNTKDGVSLEYPAFIDFRFDKEEVNYAHE